MRIYENVTRAIIEEMERGAVPWVRPWNTDRRNAGSVMPGNAITGRSYSGINVPILWASADSNGYPSHAWMTFKQAQDHGAHVRKGERGTHVVFTKALVFKGEDEEIEKRSMLREYTVFNVAQIGGFTATEKPLPPEPERHAAVDAFIAATNAHARAHIPRRPIDHAGLHELIDFRFLAAAAACQCQRRQAEPSRHVSLLRRCQSSTSKGPSMAVRGCHQALDPPWRSRGDPCSPPPTGSSARRRGSTTSSPGLTHTMWTLATWRRGDADNWAVAATLTFRRQERRPPDHGGLRAFCRFLEIATPL